MRFLKYRGLVLLATIALGSSPSSVQAETSTFCGDIGASGHGIGGDQYSCGSAQANAEKNAENACFKELARIIHDD
jgi:hypothetical protein